MKNMKGTNTIDEVEEEQSATPKQLAKILDIARNQKRLMNKKSRLEAELDETNRLLNNNKTDLLPKAMEAARTDTVPLGKGWIVDMWTEVRANVPSPDNKKVENAEELNRIGIEYIDKAAPDMVENVFTARFPKGEMKLFRKFMADMKKRKVPIDCEVRRTVNPQTLSKWVRDNDKIGRSVDETAIRVHRKKIAEVIPPKAK